MKPVGGILIALGCLILIGSGFYIATVDTGYPEYRSIYNLGALQYQLMFWQGGLALVVSGCGLVAVGALIERLEASGIVKPLELPPILDAAPGTTCDWCGQTVRAPNDPCAALDKAMLRAKAGSITNKRCAQEMRERGLMPSE